MHGQDKVRMSMLSSATSFRNEITICIAENSKARCDRYFGMTCLLDYTTRNKIEQVIKDVIVISNGNKVNFCGKVPNGYISMVKGDFNIYHGKGFGIDWKYLQGQIMMFIVA